MDRLRHDLRDLFRRRQQGLGDVGDATTTRLMRAAMARRDEPLDRRAQLIAGLATALIAVLLVATFVYIRAGLSGRSGPVGVATPSRTTKPAPVGEKSPLLGWNVVIVDGDVADTSHGWVLLTNCVQPMIGKCHYAVSGTSDAGQTWSKAVQVGGDFDPTNGDAPRHVLFINQQDGFVWGGAAVYVTHDGGAKWAALQLQATYGYDVSGRGSYATVVTYPCAKGVACPYQVLSSTDGGRTWSPPVSLPSGFEPDHGLAFSDTGELLWGQFSGDMVVTRDAGVSWMSIKTPCADGSVLNAAVATPDGKEVWEVCLHYPNPVDAANSARELFVSTDGGITWASLPIKPVPTEQAASGYLMVAGSNRYGRLVLASNQPSMMMITRDDGATWAATGPQGVGFLSIRFVDGQVGVALDMDHAIWVTTDGGDDWTQWPVTVRSPLGT